jgi:hypothetical protein
MLLAVEGKPAVGTRLKYALRLVRHEEDGCTELFLPDFPTALSCVFPDEEVSDVASDLIETVFSIHQDLGTSMPIPAQDLLEEPYIELSEELSEAIYNYNRQYCEL